MDWNHPERVFGSSLESALLRSLWRAGTPLTGAQAHRVARTGTPTGVRYALLRLVDQGIVTANRVGGSVLYDLNRAHLTFPAIDAAFQHLDPWHELQSRTSSVIDTHYPDPEEVAAVSVAVFGSVARGEADLDSDIDLLVVTPAADDRAQAFTDDLAQRVRTWTGQDVQVYLTTARRLVEARAAGDPIIDAFHMDARPLAGPDVTPLLSASS